MFVPTGFASIAIVLEGTSGTPPYIMTFGVDTGDAGGDYVEVANHAFAVFSGGLAASMDDTLVFVKAIAAVGQDDGSVVTYESNLDSVPCTNTQNFSPINCAAIANKRTAFGGRKGRGRFFIPGIVDEGNVGLDGILDDTFVEDLNDQLADMLAALDSGSPFDFPIPMVLLHGEASPVPYPVETLVLSNKIGTMRKRLR